MKSGNLNFLEPSGPLQACNGTDLRLPLSLIIDCQFCPVWSQNILHVQTTNINHYRLLCIVNYCQVHSHAEIHDKTITIDHYPLFSIVNYSRQGCHALLQVLFRRCSYILTAKRAGSSSVGVLPPGCAVPRSTLGCSYCNPTKIVPNLLQVRVKVTWHSEFDILVFMTE